MLLTDTYKHLYWKTNAEPLLGFAVGTLVCRSYHVGGGFAGSPQEFDVCPLENIAPEQPAPEFASSPPPGAGVEYRIGGRGFSTYAYKHRED